jgi:hypothetical protein
MPEKTAKGAHLAPEIGGLTIRIGIAALEVLRPLPIPKLGGHAYMSSCRGFRGRRQCAQ